ncbi:MAG TPA: outer membrane lipoprotein carrier protein LolA [Chitinophagaceae bacterium]|nr:outer membrane lipoprotein carrier protein LolA [Chitinophagaceae bacterium]
MKYFLIVSFLLVSFSAFAQPAGYSSLKDVNQFKRNFSLSSQQLQSVESDFVQVKNLSLMKNKIISSGKFYYKKENKVRIEYLKPYSYLMVLNGHAMMVKDEQKKSNFNSRNNKMMQSINNIMLDCMSGNVYNNKDFTTSVYENQKEYLLSLIPSTSMMKKMFSKIEIYLNKNDFNVLRLNMIELGGDNSLMTFTNRLLNKSLDEKLFSTK